MKIAHLVSLALWGAACGGSSTNAPPPEPPPTPQSTAVDMPDPTPAAATPVPAPTASAAAPDAPAPAKIDFPPHATVDQAVKAIPQGAPRLNMSNDVLHAPLLDLKRYDKCKVPPSTKVTMTVAVYDGAAVGVDVTTKPKNGKIEECLDGVVRGMTWDKVPSLNQVTVNF